MPASPRTTSIAELTLCEVAELVAAKSVSPLELTRACLERIEKLNPQLNAFITVAAERALRHARVAEEEIQRGARRGPLHGIPVSIKDVIDTAGVRTTAASKLFAARVPDRDAEVVRRLKQAGAVILGKTNLHEFAYGGSGVISHYGVARNPWDANRVTGGSSSGSAAAVAAGMCFASVGTDTAGSIRLPAAYCGVVGLKPTYGLVSTAGVIPLSWSYDHVGPIARTVRDAAIVLTSIAGYDPSDVCSRPMPSSDYAGHLEKSASPLRIGVARSYFWEGLDRGAADCVEEALRVLAELGCELHEIAIPVDEDRAVASAESYAYHAQFLQNRAGLYDPETLRRIRSGEPVTAAEYILKVRRLAEIRVQACTIFEHVDLMVTPTCGMQPPLIEDLCRDPARLRPTELLMLRNTRPFNVLGVPAISVPCGFTADALPVGLQLAGAPGAEESVLRLAWAYEQATNWHPRWPPGGVRA